MSELTSEKITKLFFFTIVMILVITLCACNYRWNYLPRLHSVSELEPHGTLLIVRQSLNIYVLIDGKVVFKGPSRHNTQVEFCLAPGKHLIKAKYLDVKRYSDTFKGSIVIEENKKRIFLVEYDGEAIKIEYVLENY